MRLPKVKRLISLILLMFTFSSLCIGGLFAQEVDTTVIRDLINKSSEIQYSDIKGSREYLNKSIHLSKQINNDKLEAEARYLLARVYKNSGDYQNAMDEALKSLKLYEELDDKHGMTMLNVQLGHLHFLKQTWQVCREYYDKALNLTFETGNSEATGHVHMGLGNLLMYEDSLERADLEFLMAEKAFGDKVTDELKARINANRGNINRQRKDYENSKRYYLISLEAFRTLNNRVMEALVLFNIGDLAYIQDNFEESIGFYEKSLQVGTEIKSAEDIKYAHKGLAKAYNDLKQFDQAYYHLQIYHDIKDSLQAIKNEADLLEIEVKYQTEKREKELNELRAKAEEDEKTSQERERQLELDRIKIESEESKITLLLFGGVALLALIVALLIGYVRLKNRNKLISEQSQSIQSQNDIIDGNLKEKELLLKEIHHRVKNNLQMISSMLNLQSHQVKSKESIEALQDGRMRIQAIALIHEKLYGNDQFATISSKEYINELLINQLTAIDKSGRSVSYELDVQDRELNLDTAVPLGLIISELTSNSLKHAFTESIEKPTIRIEIQNEGEEEMILHYKDNGIGLPQNIMDNLDDSLGFEIISALTEQLDGTIEIIEGAGTHIRLHLLQNK